MPSSKEYLDFILEQLSDLEDVSWRAMMGEYLLYHRGKIFGGIYDDRFLVKPTRSARAMMPDAAMEVPYPGAKEMLLVDNVENREFLRALIDAMFEELPASRTITKRRSKSLEFDKRDQRTESNQKNEQFERQ